MEESKLHSCLILYGVGVFFVVFLTVKIGSLVKNLSNSISPSCLGRFNPKSLTFPPQERHNCYDVGTEAGVGYTFWGGRKYLLSLWLKLFHCTEKHSPVKRSISHQKEIWLYNLAVCTVSWQKEIYIPPRLFLHAFIWKKHWKVNIKNVTLSFFFLFNWIVHKYCA